MKIFLSCFFYILASVLWIGCTQHKSSPERTILIDSLSSAEKNPYANGDQSPMDLSYFPASYPLQKMAGKDTTGGPVARIIYSRPHKKGRQIFGEGEQSLCKYGKEWRLGANEGTEIEFFKNATIAGTKLPKGRYILYCIPFADHWTIIFNSNLYTWGLHMDSSKDIFKTDIPTMPLNPVLEDFTMVFLPSTEGTDLLMAWDNVKTILPISFSDH